MILLVAGIAAATSIPWDFEVWAIDPVDPSEVIYVDSFGPTCAEIEVLDVSGYPVAHTCDVLGASLRGDVLVLTPDTGWPAASTITIGDAELEVAVGSVESGSIAIPVARTVADDGVTFDICRDGVVVAAVRSDTEPADLADAVLIGPTDGRVYFGTVDGSWPEAAPGTTASFWFATFDGNGDGSEWTEDVVTLSSAGKLRTDLRFYVGDDCPAATIAWTAGEEVDEQGGPAPANPKGDGGPPDDRGCGCATGTGAGWWVVLPALVAIRTRSRRRGSRRCPPTP